LASNSVESPWRVVNVFLPFLCWIRKSSMDEMNERLALLGLPLWTLRCKKSFSWYTYGRSWWLWESFLLQRQQRDLLDGNETKKTINATFNMMWCWSPSASLIHYQKGRWVLRCWT
jgi:hypothetical protein